MRRGCNRVKVIYMCHRTVTFRIHSTATTKETENSVKTHGVCLLGVSASCAMSPAHLGHWVSVSCQCQVESRNANGPLTTLRRSPSPLRSLSLGSFSLCCLSEGGKAINFPLVAELCIWPWEPAVSVSTKDRQAPFENRRLASTLSVRRHSYSMCSPSLLPVPLPCACINARRYCQHLHF